jgi:hypothetical protein
MCIRNNNCTLLHFSLVIHTYTHTYTTTQKCTTPMHRPLSRAIYLTPRHCPPSRAQARTRGAR